MEKQAATKMYRNATIFFGDIVNFTTLSACSTARYGPDVSVTIYPQPGYVDWCPYYNSARKASNKIKALVKGLIAVVT